MISYVWQDLKTKSLYHFDRVTGKTILRVLLMDGTMATLLFRLSQWLAKAHLGIFSFILVKLNSFFTNATIGHGAQIGPGFVILHSTGVVIHKSVRAGRDLIIEHEVTLGCAHRQAPILGSNIYIGAGAKIIGGARVGNNVKIGANAVVVKDIPDGATAVGVPARVIKFRQESTALARSPAGEYKKMREA